MASRSRKGGSKGFFGSIAAIGLIGAFVIGFYGIPARPDISTLPDLLVSKSETVSAWMQNCVPNAVKFDFSACSLSDNVQGPPAPPLPPVDGPTESAAVEILGQLPKAEPEKVSYNRDEWKHWVNVTSCWDVREQVLYDEAVKDSTLILLDKSDNPTADVGQACSIKSGTWNDPYSGTVITNPKDLDIDHMIPLSYAAQHGGQSWDANRKQQYANDLTYGNHLIAVKASENRSKSDKGLSEWKPSNKAYWCDYAVNWITVTKNYGLTVSPNDANVLSEMLGTCGG